MKLRLVSRILAQVLSVFLPQLLSGCGTCDKFGGNGAVAEMAADAVISSYYGGRFHIEKPETASYAEWVGWEELRTALRGSNQRMNLIVIKLDRRSQPNDVTLPEAMDTIESTVRKMGFGSMVIALPISAERQGGLPILRCTRFER